MSDTKDLLTFYQKKFAQNLIDDLSRSAPGTMISATPEEMKEIRRTSIFDTPKTKALEGSALSSAHYQQQGIQPLEYMQMVLTPEEFRGFLKGNVIKYTARCGHKDQPVKEAAKIEQYSKWLRQAYEGKTIKPMEA